ncbi:MAG: NAD(P)-dependent oxidoreductase [Bacteroidetes bacterium]|nr:NAD(P)-dependent oxidoreductase [Bacteroidota bacterium]
MKILVTGSAGHLGEAMMLTLQGSGQEIIGLDILTSRLTTHPGSITDRAFVRHCMKGVSTVYHAATLHKPHVATHEEQQFVDTNITGTLTLLQEAVGAGVQSFIFTSTTSVFGDALVPPAGEPAAWITEDVVPEPKNIYGVTKAAAEDLCQLYHRNHGLSCIVLRTSRFFPEEDDLPAAREAYADANLKANEYLYRRVDIEDAVGAHLLAARRARDIGFGKYIVSATTPFVPGDLATLRVDASSVIDRLYPGCRAVYDRLGWKVPAGLDRVYVNGRARLALGWQPKYDFGSVLACLDRGDDFRSPLAKAVGAKGYHAGLTAPAKAQTV